jgi:hypothetical protein
MQVFCTYCTADKKLEEGDIPAIKRYLGSRIHQVHDAASTLGLDFYILSGEYGLIPSSYPIPWYDHLLQAREVDELAERMAGQIRQYNIDSIVYFTNAPDKDRNLVPYRDAIVGASNQASCPCLVVEVELEDAVDLVGDR